MKQHPRVPIVTTARLEIEALLGSIAKEGTPYAWIYTCLGETIAQLSAGMRREETEAKALSSWIISAKPQSPLGRFLRGWVGPFLKIQEKHQLTYGELLSIFGGLIANHAKYHIRHERHPNAPDKPGDLA